MITPVTFLRETWDELKKVVWPTRNEIITLVDEYMKRKTIEARVCKVADNLDALAQAKGVPAAIPALKYFKEVYHITKIDWHKDAVEMILKDEIEPERSWQKK